jgi:hypothetical protein
MDSAYESRRQRVAGLAANKRAAPGSDPDARHHVEIDPAWIVLTEDEQQNGLEFFAAEPAQTAPPKLEQHREFESVPAYGDRIDLPQPTVEHAKPSVQPEAQSWLRWQEPLLAAALTAVVVGYAVISVRMMGTTADGQLASLNDRIAQRNKAAQAVTRTAAVAATRSSGTLPALEKPAALSPHSRLEGGRPSVLGVHRLAAV